MNKSFRALSHRPFLFVWIGSFLSNVGNWMENVGQGWLMATQTHSAFKVELLSFAQFAAVIFLAVPAGIIADSINRKKVILGAQIAMCFFATALAIMAHMNLISPEILLIMTFAEGAAWAFNGPAWQSVIPHIVARKDLESAIALNSIQYNLARLAGPALAGIIVAHWGIPYAFDINAISFFAVILAIWSVDFDPKIVKQSERVAKGGFTQGWTWVIANPGPKRIVLSIACFAILSAPLQGLMPYFASDILQVGPKGLGTLLACIGAGAVTGAFLLGQLPSHYPRHHLIPLSISVFGLLAMCFSRASGFIAYPILFATGIFWLLSMISCNTAMQILVPDKIRGRVMSIIIMANVGLLPFGHLLGGFLSKLIGPRDTILVTSTLLTLVGIVTLWNRVPQIDGYEAAGHPTHFKNFFSEVILASSHRADSLSLDSTAKPQSSPKK